MTRAHVTQRLLVTSLLGAAVFAGAGCSEERALVTLASEQAGPSAIALDAANVNESAQHVYWTNTYDGTAVKVPVNGGAVERLTPDVGSEAVTAWGITVNAQGVYWAVDNRVPENSMAPDRVLARLTTDDKFSEIVPDAGARWFIADDVEDIYWTNPTAGTVMKVAAGGGAAQPLAGDANNPLDSPQGIAINALHVYWANQGDDTLMRVPLDGGAAETLVTEEHAPYAIALDMNSIYWTNLDGDVKKMPLGGGAIQTLASGQGEPQGIAVDATFVYWTSRTDGKVMKAQLNGEAMTVIADEQDSPFGIAVDSTSIYWTNQGGTVMKVTK